MNSDEIAIEEVGNAIMELGQRISTVLMSILQSFGQTIQEMHAIFWQQYLEAGAPYGETEDGLMRWYREIGEARRLQGQADRIIQHHQMLADFRQKIRNE